jgi:hypothetical protein
MHEIEEKIDNNLDGELKERYHFGDIGLNWRIILKNIPGKQ